jgi:membrane-associated protein
VIELSHLALASPVSYLLAFLLPAADAIIPAVPSETLVIALGVATAGSADPRIAVLVGLAALGAFCGDNVTYLLGRRFGPGIGRRVFAGRRGTARRVWAERTLRRFGARLIVICRFIPGGRTAVTLTCGMLGYPRRSFIPATAVAGVIWACYAFFLGRVGGRAFEDRPWIGLLLAFGIALAVSGLIEAGRRVRWRQRRRPGRGRGLGRGAPARDDQAALVSDHHELGAVPGTELGHHPAHVSLRRQRAEEQASGDLVVGQSLCH